MASPAQPRQKLMRKKKGSSCGFETLGLSTDVYRGVKRKGYQVPTPIQRKTLPLILAGHDVVAMARTGSGKTAAFLIPMLERLRGHRAGAGGPRAIILSPTRELALQTDKFSRELGRYTDVRSACLVGGDSMEAQFEELAARPDVLVATPGRLMHHLSEVEDLTLRAVEYVVFDEADRLFEMGFAVQLREILRRVPEERQTLLFSATLPKLLAEFARAGLRDPQLVRLDTDTKISPDLRLEFFTARQHEKLPGLLHLLREVIPPDQQSIVFVATKHHVELLQEILRAEGFPVSVVYGAMDQAARKLHMAAFRARRSAVLVVTDVAARGLDIPLLDNVINFDFPPKPKLFVHRSGRAARAGRTGTAYSLLTHEELPFLLDLHLFLSRPLRPAPSEDEIEVTGGTALEAAREAAGRGETVFGRFPQAAVDLQAERLRHLLSTNYAVGALTKVSERAMRLYMKSRPAPSAESVRRAKEPRLRREEGTHLLLRPAVSRVDAAAAAFAEQLKAFRPRQTVLEAEGDASRGRAAAAEAMRRKRSAHEGLIQRKRQREEEEEEEEEVQEGERAEEEEAGVLGWEGGERSEQSNDISDPSKTVETPTVGEQRPAENRGKVPPGRKRRRKQRPTSFRDEEFYIPELPPNRHMEMGLSVRSGSSRPSGAEALGLPGMDLEREVLDLIPEDSQGAQQKRATYHWDKKSKKYVKLHAGETLTSSGKVRTESGAKVNVNSRGIYKKWQERTHRSVGRRGDAQGDEDDAGEPAAASGRPGRGGRGKHRGGGRGGLAASMPNARVKSELRSPEQIGKQRQRTLWKQQRGKGRGGGRLTPGGRGGGRGGGGEAPSGARGRGPVGKGKRQHAAQQRGGKSRGLAKKGRGRR